MQNITEHIHKSLIKNNKTIATAESCTGGILSSLLTQFSGSSQYFILGVITYNNQAKRSILKVPASIITRKGVVSKDIACLMAKSIRRIAKTDFGIGITGIAGPTGATPDKPVGTVFIALANKNKTICKKFIFQGNRASIRKQSALKALQLLKLVL
jgi:nicotinamide-nucleotide amidase